jgi:hypothetical protein
MKSTICLIGLLAVIVPALNASKSPRLPAAYQPATVLSVQKHEVRSPAYTAGDSPSDAPLQTDYYVYEIALRVNCATYVGRYETQLNYLPSSFVTGHQVDVRVATHLLYFNLPDGQQMKMAIVQKKSDGRVTCGG